MSINQELHSFLKEHQSASARFSTFPKVSKWKNDLSLDDFKKSLLSLSQTDLYIHIPYCENICTFCGCNIKVTKSHEEEDEYLSVLLREFQYYSHDNLEINKVYIGGGTPNFIKAQKMISFLGKLLEKNKKTNQFEIIMEMDPRFIDKETLKSLKEIGLNRVHLGIQDLNEEVLNNVNRKSDLSKIFNSLQWLKELDLQIGVDLIYGLPLQSPWSLEETIKKLTEFHIDHIANYPLAKVPWMEKIQRSYGHFEIPSTDRKLDLYLTADTLLKEKDFFNLGLGHYINKESHLFNAFKENKLVRNQMGLFNNASKNYLGLGVSAISKVNEYYKQNEKILDKYFYSSIDQRALLSRSHKQSDKEKLNERIFCETYPKSSIDQETIRESKIDESFLSNDNGLIALSEKSRHILKYIFNKSN